METHRVEKIIQPNGTVVLENLSFDEGETVEIIVLKTDNAIKKNPYPLRGTLYKYDKPFEPTVSLEDWEALK